MTSDKVILIIFVNEMIWEISNEDAIKAVTPVRSNEVSFVVNLC
jgi:hypothetical protein